MPGNLVDTITDGSAIFKIRKMVIADEQPSTDNSNLFLCADKTWKAVDGSSSEVLSVVDTTNKIVNVNGIAVSEFDTTYTSTSEYVELISSFGVANITYTDTSGANILVIYVGDSAWNFESGKSKIYRIRITVTSVAPALRIIGNVNTVVGLSDISLKASKVNYVYLELKKASDTDYIVYCYPGTPNLL